MDSSSDNIVQTVREPLLVLDGDLRVVTANRAFYHSFHVNPEQTMGRLIYELGNGQWDIPALRKLLEDVLPMDGACDDYQVEHNFPDIGQRTMLLNARRIQDGGKKTTLILLAIEDITVRRQAELEVARQRTYADNIVQTIREPLLVLDGSLRVATANRSFYRSFHVTPEQTTGRLIYELGNGQWDIPALRQLLEDVLPKDGACDDYQVEHDFPDIGRRTMLLNARRIHDGGKKITLILLAIEDITVRRQFERERATLLTNEQALRLEAEAANHSKDLFLATLSHEVRTPLNAIMGWATILRGGNSSQADVQEGMEVIERNCVAQARLIEDVLDISRIVSGKMQLHIGSCNLGEVINAAIDVVRPAANAKGIRFETDLDPAASRASCDMNRIQQVIWNLLANAIKFTPKGKAIRVTLTREHSNARIQVTDDGMGITPEFLPYVFDRFRQAESSTRRKFGGLGLGLSIVKHIVELHGGTVSATSLGEGRGATFTVDLPVRAVHVEQADADDAESDGRTRLALLSVRLDGLRVLVVDDELDARRILAKVLGEAGAIVTAAGSVNEALVAIAARNYQVLLSDISMPDRDGYDLIREVRGAGHSARELPAVALTAFAHKDDKLRVLLAGFQVHVPKPIDPHELLAVIASLTGRTGVESGALV